MNTTYTLDKPTNISATDRKKIVSLLIKQNKVRNPSLEKVERCKMLCICKVNDEIVAIGAIKNPTKSDFDSKHADLIELVDKFPLEIGYCYTKTDFRGLGLSSAIVKMLVAKHKDINLIATTEIKNGNSMINILKRENFITQGKMWKSIIPGGGFIGLFLRIVN